MGTELATALPAAIEQALIAGDLQKLTAEQRVTYYHAVCTSVGLNPLTKPFAYIVLNGKLTLYVTKDCTEQLRSIKRISLRIVAREMIDDCYVVTAEATDGGGRVDSATGAVACASLKGEAKANALMKAETKAKRRVTLSIAGLGMLDESEADSIPGAKPFVDDPIPVRRQVEATTVEPETGEIVEHDDAKFFDGLDSALTVNSDEAGQIVAAANACKLSLEILCEVFQVDAVENLPPSKFAECMARIAKYAANKAKADR